MALGYSRTLRRCVYVETSVVSYLAARQSRDLLVAARQRVTASWRETRRPTFRFVCPPRQSNKRTQIP